MSKLKLWNIWNQSENTKLVWIDRKALNGEVDSSFADILQDAIKSWGKIELTSKPKTSFKKPAPLLDGVYHSGFSKKDKNFTQTDRYKKIDKDFKASKKAVELKTQQDRLMVDNFMSNVLAPKLKDAYKNSDLTSKKLYDEKAAFMLPLDKKTINKWDIISWLVERWIDGAKQYRVLVWKSWESEAWAFVNDPKEEKYMSIGDVIYFIADLNSWWKIIFKEYSPLAWELKIWEILSFKNIYDDGKHDYLSIKIGKYTGVFYKKFLPKWYIEWQPLALQIKEIIKKDHTSIIKFDEDFYKEDNTSFEKNKIEKNDSNITKSTANKINEITNEKVA